MLCYAMLCHAMPCHAMLCYTITVLLTILYISFYRSMLRLRRDVGEGVAVAPYTYIYI